MYLQTYGATSKTSLKNLKKFVVYFIMKMNDNSAVSQENSDFLEKLNDPIYPRRPK